MSSINNVNPAILATLAQIDRNNRQLDVTQSRISTGLAVSQAQDNPTAFSEAANSRSESGNLRGVRDGLNAAASVIDTATGAGGQISSILGDLRQLAVQASDPTLSATQRQSLSDEFKARAALIDQISGGAEFNRLNLLNNSQPGGLRFLADASGAATLQVQPEDLRLGGANITVTSATDLSSTGAAASAIDAIDQSIAATSNALGRLGLTRNQLTAHQTFLTQLSDALENSAGRQVDANLASESARLSALQVSQQLSAQSLSIANSAPDAILALFR